MGWGKDKTLGLFVKTSGKLSKPLLSGIGHILCFHRVVDPDGRKRIWSSSGKEISVEKFLFIINYFLKKNYEFISMDTLFERLRKRRFPGKFVAITFDDGYKDNYTTAYPLLKELGIPFAIYITTAMPDNEMILWPYFLEEFILSTREISFEYNERKYHFHNNNQEEIEITYNAIRDIILENEKKAVPFFMENVFHIEQCKAKKLNEELSVSWDQLHALCKSQIATIGAHGKTHHAISTLDSITAKEEILFSKNRLEEKLNVKIEHFAYPYGTYNEFGERECAYVKDYGFKTAVTLLQGNIFKKHRRYTERLPRVPLNNNITKEVLDEISSGIRHFSFNGFRKII